MATIDFSHFVDTYCFKIETIWGKSVDFLLRLYMWKTFSHKKWEKVGGNGEK